MTDLAGKRVMVTGGAGFLGRPVCALLRERGVDVLIIPRSNQIDLTDQQATLGLFQETHPEIVIHLAAEVGGIGANLANPGRFFYANMAMGLNVIEESRIHGVEKFVQVGTVCAYPKHTPVPFREEDLWNGYPEETNAPYGIAKKALLVMLQSYRAQYGFNGIYLLPANLYGPGDNFDPETSHVIPALIRKFVEAKESGAAQVEIWGTGQASREFLYVDDAARAIVLAAENYEGSDPLNLGTGTEVTIGELVSMIQKLTGFAGDLTWDSSKPNGQPRRSLDVSMARALLGFQAQTNLSDGLRATIDRWTGSHASKSWRTDSGSRSLTANGH